MKTTDIVIEDVKRGAEVSEDELRYAVSNLSFWQNQAMSAIAGALLEDSLSEKSKRKLESAYESAQRGNKVPLDVRLKGGSFEPGITREESIRRSAESISSVAHNLSKVLGKSNE